MDQQSAYARMDFVEGKFREYDKRRTDDMNIIKSSFDVWSERVIKLEAVVESLQKMVALQGVTNKPIAAKQQSAGGKKWLGLSEAWTIMKRTYSISSSTNPIAKALRWDNLAEQGKDTDKHWHLTEKGEKIPWLKCRLDSSSNPNIEINPDCLDVCYKIVVDYLNYINARRPEQ